MTPSEVVSLVESEMSQFRSCPYCGQYGSLEQHQAGCVYLSAKSEMQTEEKDDEEKDESPKEDEPLKVDATETDDGPELDPLTV